MKQFILLLALASTCLAADLQIKTFKAATPETLCNYVNAWLDTANVYLVGPVDYEIEVVPLPRLYKHMGPYARNDTVFYRDVVDTSAYNGGATVTYRAMVTYWKPEDNPGITVPYYYDSGSVKVEDTP